MLRAYNSRVPNPGLQVAIEAGSPKGSAQSAGLGMQRKIGNVLYCFHMLNHPGKDVWCFIGPLASSIPSELKTLQRDAPPGGLMHLGYEVLQAVRGLAKRAPLL